MARFWTVAFALFAAFIIALVLIANSGHGPWVFSAFTGIPHYDKIGHFVLMGMLSLFAVAAIAPRMKWSTWCSSIAVMAAVALVVSLEEFSQSQVASRTFSMPDLAFSLAGIACLGLVGHVIAARLRRQRLSDA